MTREEEASSLVCADRSLYYTGGPWGTWHCFLSLLLWLVVLSYALVAGYLFMFRPLTALLWLLPFGVYIWWVAPKQEQAARRRRRKRTRSLSEGELGRAPNAVRILAFTIRPTGAPFDVQADEPERKACSDSPSQLLRSRSFPGFPARLAETNILDFRPNSLREVRPLDFRFHAFSERLGRAKISPEILFHEDSIMMDPVLPNA
eukprot:gb/GEZN01006164.1/.p1 GENE.gb/GEZN01006164.1/~~gb/GEZN01006164.1/.p1  ORF type:complete len:204 (+),score=15.45 gb/GEZN01006164.1/:46-657(+)